MNSENIDLYNSKICDDYERYSHLVQYDLNDSFIDDSQCSFDVNSDNTYETETEYSSDCDTIKSINDEMVYEMNHMNCGYEIKLSYDLRSYERNFYNCVEKPEKFMTSTGFEPVTSRFRCDALTN